MNTPQLLLYFLSLTSVLLAVLTLAVTSAYYKLNHKYRNLRDQEDRLRRSKRSSRRARKKSKKLIEEAMDKSQTIISESGKKAQEIINQANMFTDEQKAKMSEGLSSITNQQSENFRVMLDEVKNESINILNNISKDVKEDTEREIEVLRGGMQKQVIDFADSVKQTAETERKKLEEEVSRYKDEMLQKVNENITKIIKQVSQEVIGKALSPEEHEDIVISALEDAKRRNIL